MNVSKAVIHVLLIEDDYTDAELIQYCLRYHNPNLHITWLEDGEEALSYLKNCEPGELPTLVISDMKMPKLTGGQVLAELKEIPHLANLPIALMSSSPLPRDLQQIRSLGVDEYFVKPVTLTDLRQTAREILLRWDLI